MTARTQLVVSCTDSGQGEPLLGCVSGACCKWARTHAMVSFLLSACLLSCEISYHGHVSQRRIHIHVRRQPCGNS